MDNGNTQTRFAHVRAGGFARRLVAIAVATAVAVAGAVTGAGPARATVGVDWVIGSTTGADKNWISVTYGTPGGSGLCVAIANNGSTGNNVMTSPY